MIDRSQLSNDFEEAMRVVLDGRQATIWTSMPGIVQSVDFVAMTCTIQLAIQGTVNGMNGSQTLVNIAVLQDCPIVFPSAGGFTFTLPLAIDDEVLVIFSSRCIDSWWQNGGFANAPIEVRMHDLSDGFCIPGIFSQPNVLSNVSSTDAQLRNKAGTTYISLTSTGKIKLVAPAEIDITAPLVNVTGNLVVSGQVTGSGIALSTHVHSGVTSGSSDTGVPI